MATFVEGYTCRLCGQELTGMFLFRPEYHLPYAVCQPCGCVDIPQEPNKYAKHAPPGCTIGDLIPEGP